jgi:putative DNA primase/helicase
MYAERLSDVTDEEAMWVWPGRVALRTLTLIAGDPGVGKGLLLVDIAARITTGAHMPRHGPSTSQDSAQGPNPRDVLFCCAEDSSSTMKMRAMAAGADLNRIHIMAPDESSRRFDKAALSDAISMLESVLNGSDIRLVVIDPVTGFFPDLASNSDSMVRATLTALTRLAERRNCAIVIVLHLNKQIGAAAIYRGGGSVAFAAVPRSAFLVGSDPTDSSDRLLACVKTNLGVLPPSLAFTIAQSQHGPKIEWLGESEYNVEEIVAVTPSSRRRTRQDQAAEFLLTLLSDGPMAEKEIRAKAEEAGITLFTLRNAKVQLRVISKKSGYGAAGEWIWMLPEHDEKV